MSDHTIIVSETFINCFAQELAELRLRLDEMECAAWRAREIYHNLANFMDRLKAQQMNKKSAQD